MKRGLLYPQNHARQIAEAAALSCGIDRPCNGIALGELGASSVGWVNRIRYFNEEF